MKAVHFGGGNIGRGFIGLLLSRAGYRVVFVDVNEQLVELLNERGQYPVQLASQTAETTIVRGVSAVNGKDKDKAAQHVAEADLVTTAVGVHALQHIADTIALGIQRRLSGYGNAELVRPLHVIACENAIGGSTRLRQLVEEYLPPEIREAASRGVAFPDAAVDRIVPLQHHDDPLKVVVEPFYEWVVDRSAMLEGFPVIEGVHYADRLEPYIERKLFTVNTGHCTAAYHGYLRGHPTIQDAMKDEAVLREVTGVLAETGAVLCRKYGFDPAGHDKYIEKIVNRFSNPYLRDEVVRVGRSPIRKISPDDRLIRPAQLASDYGIDAAHLAKAVAAALLFDYWEDPEAAELSASLESVGASAALTRYTGLPEDNPLHRAIMAAYESLKAEIQ